MRCFFLVVVKVRCLSFDELEELRLLREKIEEEGDF